MSGLPAHEILHRRGDYYPRWHARAGGGAATRSGLTEPDRAGADVLRPASLEIHLTGDRFRFFDYDGQLVRVQLHISEDNTSTNLDTGETYREGPDNFMQTTLFTDDGPLIVGSGLAANVQGAQLKGVGRVVINPLTGEIVLSAGQHPLPEAQEAGNVLEGFCVLFD